MSRKPSHVEDGLSVVVESTKKKKKKKRHRKKKITDNADDRKIPPSSDTDSKQNEDLSDTSSSVPVEMSEIERMRIELRQKEEQLQEQRSELDAQRADEEQLAQGQRNVFSTLRGEIAQELKEKEQKSKNDAPKDKIKNIPLVLGCLDVQFEFLRLQHLNSAADFNVQERAAILRGYVERIKCYGDSALKGEISSVGNRIRDLTSRIDKKRRSQESKLTLIQQDIAKLARKIDSAILSDPTSSDFEAELKRLQNEYAAEKERHKEKKGALDESSKKKQAERQQQQQSFKKIKADVQRKLQDKYAKESTIPEAKQIVAKDGDSKKASEARKRDQQRLKRDAEIRSKLREQQQHEKLVCGFLDLQFQLLTLQEYEDVIHALSDYSAAMLSMDDSTLRSNIKQRKKQIKSLKGDTQRKELAEKRTIELEQEQLRAMHGKIIYMEKLAEVANDPNLDKDIDEQVGASLEDDATVALKGLLKRKEAELATQMRTARSIEQQEQEKRNVIQEAFDKWIRDKVNAELENCDNAQLIRELLLTSKEYFILKFKNESTLMDRFRQVVSSVQGIYRGLKSKSAVELRTLIEKRESDITTMKGLFFTADCKLWIARFKLEQEISRIKQRLDPKTSKSDAREDSGNLSGMPVIFSMFGHEPSRNDQQLETKENEFFSNSENVSQMDCLTAYQQVLTLLGIDAKQIMAYSATYAEGLRSADQRTLQEMLQCHHDAISVLQRIRGDYVGQRSDHSTLTLR